jgi:HD-GYP domain-containing protein (c-di-GMP phosphodiesterase class II)
MPAENNFKKQIERLTEIGIGLSAELNLDALLDKIVRFARELSGADAGTLYLLLDGRLHFKILQNESLGIFQGGLSEKRITLEPVPLDKTNVSAFAALLKRTVRIQDVYKSEGFDFSGPRRYDAITGYHSKSMLVVPMKDHEGTVIGVLQLMNALDARTKEVIPFGDAAVNLTEALASQAAIAISNARLIQETKDLFEGLIKVLALALDARSHATRKHIQRVARLNFLLAIAINKKTTGPFANVRFTKDELEEIRLAGWLHDVGKVTTPNWVMEKRTKLEKPFDLIELIRMRFAVIRENLQSETMIKKETFEPKLAELENDFRFLCECNSPREGLDPRTIERLHSLAQKTYIEDGEAKPYLTVEELTHLSVRRGNLTDDELCLMREHIIWTKKMLGEIPFKGRLKNVPVYASQHHERLNGTGYPDGLTDKDLPLQSRILAVADVFEALTAADRSYKKPMSLEEAFAILRKAAGKGELDKDVVELLIEDRVYESAFGGIRGDELETQKD